MMMCLRAPLWTELPVLTLGPPGRQRLLDLKGPHVS